MTSASISSVVTFSVPKKRNTDPEVSWPSGHRQRMIAALKEFEKIGNNGKEEPLRALMKFTTGYSKEPVGGWQQLGKVGGYPVTFMLKPQPHGSFTLEYSRGWQASVGTKFKEIG